MVIMLEGAGVDAGARVTVAVEDADIVVEGDGSGATKVVITRVGRLSEAVDELSAPLIVGGCVGILDEVRSVLLAFGGASP